MSSVRLTPGTMVGMTAEGIAKAIVGFVVSVEDPNHPGLFYRVRIVGSDRGKVKGVVVDATRAGEEEHQERRQTG